MTILCSFASLDEYFSLEYWIFSTQTGVWLVLHVAIQTYIL